MGATAARVVFNLSRSLTTSPIMINAGLIPFSATAVFSNVAKVVTYVFCSGVEPCVTIATGKSARTPCPSKPCSIARADYNPM